MALTSLPIPDFFAPAQVGTIWRVPYQERVADADAWTRTHGILPADQDATRICLVTVDVQNTFCIPGFELYVGGRSGTAAVDDNRRLCEFIYRNLHVISQVVPTMDTHRLMAVFHPIYLVNDAGEHPQPFTLISYDDVADGRWRFNSALGFSLGVSPEEGQRRLLHYTRVLKQSGKYELTIWPYHAMLGGIGHALVSAVEEAVFFHSVARFSRPDFQIKGNNPFTEHYSVLGPEVTEDPDGKPLARRNQALVEELLKYDAVIIAGQAKSHCVAWTIADLLSDVLDRDHRLAKKVYLLEDCTSPVVMPGVIDYTEQADAAFQRFADAGMRVVRSTDAIADWPGINV
jgi:nicotinamidase-related amidase